MKKLTDRDIDFEIRKERSYSVECPRCVGDRKKSRTRTLYVNRDEDGYIRVICMHDKKCFYGEGASFPDTVRVDMPVLNPKNQIKSPMTVEIPAEHLGNKVYAYKDIDGNPLFGVIRFDLPTGKLFAPYAQAVSGKILAGKGASFPEGKALYRAEHIEGKEKILVVEGEKAADAAAELFKDYDNLAVVSWRGGSNGIKNGDWDLLQNASTVYLWPDNDEPGIRAMAEIARMISGPEVKTVDVSMFPPKSDLADNLDMDLVKEAIATARPEGPAQDVPFKAMTLSMLDREDKLVGEITAETGLPLLDAKTPLPKNGIVVLTARSGHGKTTMGLNIALDWLKNGKRVVIFNLETTSRRVFRTMARVLDPSRSAEDIHESTEAWETMRGYVESGLLHIYGQDEQMTGVQIAKMLDSDYYRGCLVVVDYVQIVDHGDSYLPAYKAIKSLVVDPFRKVVNRRKMLMLLMSQLTEGANHGEDKAREAKDIHMSAEMVLQMWNKTTGARYDDYDRLPGTFIIRVVKNRSGKCGIIYSGRIFNGARIELDEAYDGDFLVKAHTDKAASEREWKKRVVEALEGISGSFGAPRKRKGYGHEED